MQDGLRRLIPKSRCSIASKQRALLLIGFKFSSTELNSFSTRWDPSPFPDKDLDEDAEEFIVSWVQEFPTNDPISLVIQVNQLPARGDVQESVQTAIHNYFAYRMKLKGFELRRLLKQGRTSLFIGLAFLSACLLISHMLIRQWPGTWSDLVQESLTIGGWVAMWRPMEIFLYEWWPIRRSGRLYQKMSRMHVEVKKRAVEAS